MGPICLPVPRWKSPRMARSRTALEDLSMARSRTEADNYYILCSHFLVPDMSSHIAFRKTRELKVSRGQVLFEFR